MRLPIELHYEESRSISHCQLNNLQNNKSSNSIKAPFLFISLSTISEADVLLFLNNLICFSQFLYCEIGILLTSLVIVYWHWTDLYPPSD